LETLAGKLATGNWQLATRRSIMNVLATFLKVLTGIFNVLPLAISIAETIGRLFRPGQKSGAEKLAAVKQVVRNALVASELLTGKEIVNEDLLDQGITEITNGAVKVLNAIKQ
jgi:hypothetical protein